MTRKRPEIKPFSVVRCTAGYVTEQMVGVVRDSVHRSEKVEVSTNVWLSLSPEEREVYAITEDPSLADNEIRRIYLETVSYHPWCSACGHRIEVE